MSLPRSSVSLRHRLTPMRWTVLAMALVIAGVTALLAVALLDATGRPPQYSTQ